jgi:hypothetical protein
MISAIFMVLSPNKLDSNDFGCAKSHAHALVMQNWLSPEQKILKPN